MIKPDGVQRGLVGAIIARFETKGFYLRGMKMMSVTKEHAEKHYADLSSKPFFGDLVDYMCSGPVVCMVWEGKEVVKTGRKIIGATNPLCVPLPSPPSIADAAAADTRRFRVAKERRAERRRQSRSARARPPPRSRRVASRRVVRPPRPTDSDALNPPPRRPPPRPTAARPSPARSAATTASSSDATSSTARTRWTPRSTRSASGSRRASPSTRTPRTRGSTSERRRGPRSPRVAMIRFGLAAATASRRNV